MSWLWLPGIAVVLWVGLSLWTRLRRPSSTESVLTLADQWARSITKKDGIMVMVMLEDPFPGAPVTSGPHNSTALALVYAHEHEETIGGEHPLVMEFNARLLRVMIRFKTGEKAMQEFVTRVSAHLGLEREYVALVISKMAAAAPDSWPDELPSRAPREF